MKTTERIYRVGISFAALALFLAYSLEQFWLGAILALGLGFLEWYAHAQRKWVWSSDLFFAGSLLLITLGGLIGVRPVLLMPALCGAIAAWDLTRFQQRLGNIPVTETSLKIEKRHLSWLAAALLSGIALAVLVLNFRLQLSFGVSLALAVIVIIVLGQIYRQMRN